MAVEDIITCKAEIYEAFETLKRVVDIEILSPLVASIAFVLVAVQLAGAVRQAQGGNIWERLRDIVLLSWYPMMIVMAGGMFTHLVPALHRVFEDITGLMATSLPGWSGPYEDMVRMIDDAVTEQLGEGDWSMFGSAMSLGLVQWLDVLLSKGLASIACLYFKYVVVLFMARAYFEIFLHEFISPFAIVSVLNERTRQHFIQWIKSYMLCYLEIPLMLIACYFADEISKAMMAGMDTRFYLGIIILCCILKTRMIAIVSKIKSFI